MSLQSIMDATPIEWKYNRLGYYVGSGNKFTYLIEKVSSVFMLRWIAIIWDRHKEFMTNDPQEIIDKIKELEGD